MLYFGFERKLILTAAVIVLASAVTAVALTPALSGQVRPLLQSLAMISCSRSSPCQEGINSSTGAGLEGISIKGKGVVGQTKFNSTSATNGQSGVVGQDLSTGGQFDAGVTGLSTIGVGVLGKNSGGLNGSPAVQGVSTDGPGAFGTSANSAGLIGISTNLDGVIGETFQKSATTHTAHFGVHGIDRSTDGGALNIGVEGDSNGGIGVAGFSRNIGVLAFGGASTTGDSFPALSVVGDGTGADLIDACATADPCDSNSSVLFVGIDGTISALGPVNASNIATGGALAVGNASLPSPGSVNISGQYQKSGLCVAGCTVATTTSAGREAITYSPMVSQPTVEDYGEAQLVDGQSHVRLSPDFANVVDQRSNYLVFITPEGEANTLYVTQKSPSGFFVREIHGGRSTIAFSYRILAKPFGSHEGRLPIVEVPRLHHGRSRVRSDAKP